MIDARYTELKRMLEVRRRELQRNLGAKLELPVRFREILVLRELEGLSYKEIADVMGVPMGTVMSTLSRARDRFRHAAGHLINAHVSSASDSPAVKSRECVGAPAGNKFVVPRVSSASPYRTLM